MTFTSDDDLDALDTIERRIDVDAGPARVWALVSVPGWWIAEGDLTPNEVTEEGDDVFRVTPSATFNVLTRAAEAGVRRAVIASSINAIGYPNNPHDTFPPAFPLDVETPPDIADAYSLSKLADEATARYAHRRYGIDVVALRFPLVKWPHVLREVADEVRADPARMAREGWAYLTMSDAVRAVERALWADVAGAEVVPLSARDTLLDVPTAELLRRYAPAVEPPAHLAGHDALVDLTTARTVLGFEPRESIHDGTATPYPALVRSDR